MYTLACLLLDCSNVNKLVYKVFSHVTIHLFAVRMLTCKQSSVQSIHICMLSIILDQLPFMYGAVLILRHRKGEAGVFPKMMTVNVNKNYMKNL